MGMFDTVNLNVRCPICNDGSPKSCQTKDLENTLNYFYVGDYVGTKQLRFINCIVVCGICVKRSPYPKNNGCSGYFFEISVFIDEDGILTSNYEYTNQDNWGYH